MLHVETENGLVSIQQHRYVPPPPKDSWNGPQHARDPREHEANQKMDEWMELFVAKAAFVFRTMAPFVVIFVSTRTSRQPLQLIISKQQSPVDGDVFNQVRRVRVRDDDAFRGDRQRYFAELLCAGSGLRIPQKERNFSVRRRAAKAPKLHHV